MPTDQTRTTELVHQAQGGDERAFAALVRAYQDVAVAFAAAILRDHHLAEDAAQEAFVDAHRALASLREPAAFGRWLRTIVFKHCDRITRRRQHPTTDLDAARDVAASDPTPHEALESRETRARVRLAVAALPWAEREAVLLYYLGERSHGEIAALLGVTPNTVKTRLYAARRRLRRHMGEIERQLDAARPSRDAVFAERVARLVQPDALARDVPWPWSPGIGTNVWATFVACLTGDLAAVRRLVDADPSLVRAHYEYRTPLSFAVRENHVDVAAFLLDRGADPLALGDLLETARERGHDAMTAMLETRLARLHGASSAGEPVAAALRARDLDAVRRLLDATPALLHAGDGRSSQPIHWAVMTRQLDAIDELLARGADPDARRQDGARPVHLTNGDYHYRGWRDVPAAVAATPDDVYRHLVARGAIVDLGMAAATGDAARVRQLLDADPALVNRVSDYRSYYVGCGAPIKNAAVGGHLEIVRLLLDRGADPNLPEEGIAPRGHALYSAVYHGHHAIAELLLARGAYPNPAVESSADAVWIAIRNGDRRMLALLASYGAAWEIPIRPENGLTYDEIVATGIGRTIAILADNDDVATATARLAADPALADDPDALQIAAERGHEAFVRLMLQHRPDLAARVTVSRPRAMAELLFAHGMDASRPDWMRITPLHRFAERGDAEGAALFLDHGADLHARDEELRSTPLAWAARAGRVRLVELLLERGASLTRPDDPPWATPLAWATRRGHDAVVRLLTAYADTGVARAHDLAWYAALATDVVAACASGETGAFQRVMDAFGIERMLTWDRPPHAERVARLRRAVGERLGGVVGEALAIADARRLVAREHGYERWEALERSLGAALPSMIDAARQRHRTDRADRADRTDSADPFNPSDPSWVVAVVRSRASRRRRENGGALEPSQHPALPRRTGSCRSRPPLLRRYPCSPCHASRPSAPRPCCSARRSPPNRSPPRRAPAAAAR